eukprot:scaffold81534_cov31-Tisochrysis_lutea.AAC.3
MQTASERLAFRVKKERAGEAHVQPSQRVAHQRDRLQAGVPRPHLQYLLRQPLASRGDAIAGAEALVAHGAVHDNAPTTEKLEVLLEHEQVARAPVQSVLKHDELGGAGDHRESPPRTRRHRHPHKGGPQTSGGLF